MSGYTTYTQNPVMLMIVGIRLSQVIKDFTQHISAWMIENNLFLMLLEHKLGFRESVPTTMQSIFIMIGELGDVGVL